MGYQIYITIDYDGRTNAEQIKEAMKDDLIIFKVNDIENEILKFMLYPSHFEGDSHKAMAYINRILEKALFREDYHIGHSY